MFSIEFQAKIENGTIRVPKQYRQYLQKQSGGQSDVRVIILISEQQPAVDFIDELLANPIAAKDFIPLDRDDLHERN